MYFLPKNNWAYAMLVTLNPLQRWLITGVLIVGIAYGWFFGIYTPLARSLESQKKSIDHYAQQHAVAQKSAETTKRLESSLNIASHALKEYSRPGSVASSDTLQATMALIFGIAQRYGVIIVMYSIKKESAQELYITHHIHLDCTGSLDAVMQMLDALHANHVIITYDHVAMSKMPENHFSVRMDCILSVLI